MRLARWLLLLVAVPSAVAWLAVSLVHLIGSATEYHQRVVQRAAGVPLPTDAVVQRLLSEQNHWGVLAMFAVASVALALVMTLATWLLSEQRARADRRRGGR